MKIVLPAGYCNVEIERTIWRTGRWRLHQDKGLSVLYHMNESGNEETPLDLSKEERERDITGKRKRKGGKSWKQKGEGKAAVWKVKMEDEGKRKGKERGEGPWGIWWLCRDTDVEGLCICACLHVRAPAEERGHFSFPLPRSIPSHIPHIQPAHNLLHGFIVWFDEMELPISTRTGQIPIDSFTDKGKWHKMVVRTYNQLGLSLRCKYAYKFLSFDE